MMPHHQHPERDLLELYLDGLLSPNEVGEFERTLSDHPEWQRAITLQRKLNERITREFAPEDHSQQMFEAIRNSAPSSATQVGRSQSWLTRFRRPAMVAACLAMIAVGGWQAWVFLAPQPKIDVYGQMPWRTLADVYQHAVTGRFRPVWKCEDNEQFAKFVSERFGQPLVLATLPVGVEALGWSYSNSLSAKTAHILCQSGETRFLVFVDRTENVQEKAVVVPPDSKMFRREIGALSAIEITPLGRPTLIDFLQQP